MSQPEYATSRKEDRKTDVGSVFVSNYPPFSFWRQGPEVAERALDAPPRPGVPLGLYAHVPFCRKRCKFCYFRVYTGKNADDVKRYLDALVREVEMLALRPAVAGRPLAFVYFGGGTPSFISARHLQGMVSRLRGVLPWEEVREVTFECEPGTLTQSKLEAIRQIGVTRLSLGVESFDDAILRENGRAHVSKEIFRCWPWIEALAFPQVNVDLIAGMLGESWDSWRSSVEKTIELGPDAVTIYQLELPYNTVFSRRMLEGSLGRPVADWETKRAWHGWAMARLGEAGYELSSAYTMVRKKGGGRFLYRDSLWHGADMLGTGVASFSHLSGVHFQNVDSWEGYLGAVEAGRLPLHRALAIDADEQLTRELVLQMKLGRVELPYFRTKFGVDVAERFAAALSRLEKEGMVALEGDHLEVTRRGLLQVDGLLPELYDPKYRGGRYT